ncbi:MAG: hypothetical protein COA58_14650 [Bacteroidetes bacterium]|nr:MAG: hypothetical protein COA58_14650 [Bacteroidota bacterium]
MQLSKLIIAITLLGIIGCNNNKNENHGHQHGPSGEHLQENVISEEEEIKQEVFDIDNDTLTMLKKNEPSDVKNHSNEEHHKH